MKSSFLYWVNLLVISIFAFVRQAVAMTTTRMKFILLLLP